jgi:hypothetical protein
LIDAAKTLLVSERHEHLQYSGLPAAAILRTPPPAGRNATGKT